MIDWIMNIYQSVLDGTKAYPQAQAALVTTSSVVAAGAIGFLLMKLPRILGKFFSNQCMTKLVFNTSATNYSQYNQMQYLAFLRWFAKNSWFNWSRVVTLDGETYSDKGAVGPGVGTHFFIYQRRFYFFSIIEMDSQGSDYSKYKISISVIGRSKKPLYELMDAFMEKSDHENTITVYQAGTDEWNWLTRSNKRSEESVVLSENVIKELIEPLKEFQASREWYYKRGLDYKFCVLLYGPPGTGKSSLARVIASMLGRNLHLLSPGGSVSYNALFQRAKGGVILMEDIDTYGVARKRTSAQTDVEAGKLKPVSKNSFKETSTKDDDDLTGDTLGDALSEFMGGSLSELLNALQGVISLDDVIVIMTTNHPEKLDPALIRDGRVDARVEVGYLSGMDIAKYYSIVYEKEYLGSETFPSLPASTVHKTFLKHKFSPDGFVSEIMSKQEESNIFQLAANTE